MDIIYYSTVITKSLETKEASPTVVQIMAYREFSGCSTGKDNPGKAY